MCFLLLKAGKINLKKKKARDICLVLEAWALQDYDSYRFLVCDLCYQGKEQQCQGLGDSKRF